jgi:hypothetical protein
MRKRLGLVASTVAFLMFVIPPVIGRAQNPSGKSGVVDPGDQEQHLDGWGRPVPKPAEGKTPDPAPRHDISGTWEPPTGWRNGVQASGAYNYPMDGKHQVPFTPAGEQAWKTHKYGDGEGSYALTEVNDPFEMCDPIGFPRVDLHDLSGSVRANRRQGAGHV